MRTTNDYLDLIAQKDLASGGTGSDYAVAKRLNITRQRMSQLRHGSTFGDEICLRVASVLDISAGEVLASMHAEREKNSSLRDAWQKLAETAGRTAAAFAFAAITVPVLIYAHPPLSEQNQPVATVYYVKIINAIRRLRSTLKSYRNPLNYLVFSPAPI